MVKKRNVYDIVYDLLFVLEEAECMVKTRLCSAVGLPLDRCNALLGLMMSYGLIHVRSDDRHLICMGERG